MSVETHFEVRLLARAVGDEFADGFKCGAELGGAGERTYSISMRDEYFRKCFVSKRHVDVVFVVPKRDIVDRLVFLDKLRLYNKRLNLGSHLLPVQPVSLLKHRMLTEAIAEIDRFANIHNPALGVSKKVNSRRLWNI